MKAIEQDIADAVAERMEIDRELNVAVEIANDRLSTAEHPADYCAVCGEPTGSDRPGCGIPDRGRDLVIVHVTCSEKNR